MTPRLNKELSQKLHDAGIVVESEKCRYSLLGDSWTEPFSVCEAYKRGFNSIDALISAPTLLELLMTKEAGTNDVGVRARHNGVIVFWHEGDFIDKHFPDWQSATDYVAELLLKNKVG